MLRWQPVAGARSERLRVFVTGGSGFVGGHVIEGLVRAGHEVWAMARSDSSAAVVAGFGATPVRCDLDTVAAEHLQGCDAVVHSAAHVEEWGTREVFWRLNVAGTDRMLAAARQAGALRFVQISTEQVLAGRPDLLDLDETLPYPEHPPYLYGETKAESERRVLAASADGFTTMALRPRLVWGPRDNTILPGLIAMVRRGAFVWADGGRTRTAVTHIDNLVHAVVLALAHGRAGQAYFIADAEEHVLRDFFTRLAATRGVTLPTRSLPGWLLSAVAAAAELPWRLAPLPGRPPVTAIAVALMRTPCTIRIDKARSELGYEPVVTAEQGLSALLEGVAR